MKDRLAERQNWRCALCGGRLNEPQGVYWSYYTYEHVVPLRLGGADEEDNLVITHRVCNDAKDRSE